MDIRITGRNLDITDSIRAYIEKKLGRLSRFSKISEIHVILSLERHLAVVEAILKTRNRTFYGSESSENLYEAVDALLDNLRSQLKKHKEKIIDTHRISS